jgi:hypothetical protein
VVARGLLRAGAGVIAGRSVRVVNVDQPRTVRLYDVGRGRRYSQAIVSAGAAGAFLCAQVGVVFAVDYLASVRKRLRGLPE